MLKNHHSTEMCSGSGAGSYLRLIDFEYHSTLGLRVMKKRKKLQGYFAHEILPLLWVIISRWRGWTCRLIDFVYHSTLGVRRIKKKKSKKRTRLRPLSVKPGPPHSECRTRVCATATSGRIRVGTCMQVLGRIARGQRNRLTSRVTSPLQEAEVQNPLFSPLKRGRDPGSPTIFFPLGYPGRQ